MGEVKNLMQGLLEQRDRVKDLLKTYEQLPNNAGAFGAIILRDYLSKADNAITTGDVIEMIKCYENLKNAE